MANNKLNSGMQLIVTLGAVTTVKSGLPLKVGSIVGVVSSLTRAGQTVFTNQASASGDIAVVELEGTWELAKSTSVPVTQGARLYWDNGNSVVTTVADGNTFIGFAYEAELQAATTVKVILLGGDSSGESGLSEAATVAALAGTLTGSVTGTMADVADIALSTTDTYTDAAVNAAVNTAVAETNLGLKELQTTVNSILTSLKAAGIMASA